MNPKGLENRASLILESQLLNNLLLQFDLIQNAATNLLYNCLILNPAGVEPATSTHDVESDTLKQNLI